MPWCPKCRDEYQEGYTFCSDCNVELVEELPPEENLISFFESGNKEIAEKLINYFEHSDLKATLQFDEKNAVYEVLIPPEMQLEAKRLYHAFYTIVKEKYEEELNEDLLSDDDSNSDEVEPRNDDEKDTSASDTSFEETEENNINNDEEDSIQSDQDDFKKMDELLADVHKSQLRKESSSYVMKADQYRDLNSTVAIFSFFGIAGIIFVALNIAGVIPIFNSWLFNIMGTALFLYFIYVGLSTYKKAKQVKLEIEDENKLTNDINEWLSNNVTKDFLATHHDESISEELNYLKLFEIIREMLIEEFGEQNTDYLDQLIENFYNKNFDTDEDTVG